MRRREVIVGLALFLSARRAEAQAGKVRRIALVHPSAPAADMTTAGDNRYFRAFFDELSRLGHVEGRNLIVQRHSGEGRVERHSELAGDVAGSDPDLIFVVSGRLTRAMRAQTETIPIVALTSDPVALGVAQSLARPGGNVTGVTSDAGLELRDKHVELLKAALPGASKVALLAPRSSWRGAYGEATQAAARRLGMELVGEPLEDPVREPEYRRVFAAMIRDGADALVVGDQPENFTNRKLVVDLATESRLPTIYPFREFAEAGGLISYGPDVADLFRRAAHTVSLVLHGEKVADFPFHQPTKFELVINLRSAKALGLAIPFSLLARADEVIE